MTFSPASNFVIFEIIRLVEYKVRWIGMASGGGACGFSLGRKEAFAALFESIETFPCSWAAL